jgi:hypothetical protein
LSNLTSGWAWKQDLKGTDKLVLVALADNADDEGVCWPGQKFLAEKCGMTDRSVRTILTRLEEAHLIRRSPRFRRDGSRSSDLIELAVAGPFSAPEDSSAGNTLPPVNHHGGVGKDQGNLGDTATVVAREDARELPAYTFNRKRVTKEEWRRVAHIMGKFNRTFGTSFGAKDKDMVSRVVMVLRSPAGAVLSDEDYERIIDNNAKAPWWGAETPDTIGVIFSPRAFPKAARNNGVPTGRKAAQAQEASVLARLDAMIARGDT